MLLYFVKLYLPFLARGLLDERHMPRAISYMLEAATSPSRAAPDSPSAPGRGNSAHTHKSAAANNKLGSGGGTVNARGSPGGRDGAITARTRKAAAGAGGANSPPGEEAYEAGVGSRVAVGDTIKANEEEEEEQWEGVVWDEDETNEVDSLGAVSASVGTMEVASLHEESSQAGATAPEPQDLLIRVIGIDDIREVIMCRHSLFIGNGENALHFLPLPQKKRTIKYFFDILLCGIISYEKKQPLVIT